ncbi:MAG TPA: ECF transporter S component [Anaerolineaceae bacterium]|nr:ECF transporter S component [Longilinea sp.]HQF45152.1 ECF transporter S component [Anaerolineaceae bacterium]
MTEIEELPQNIHCPDCNKEFNQPVDFCDNCGLYLQPLFFPEGVSAPGQDEIEPGDGSQPTIARGEEGISTETVEAPGDSNQPTIARDEEGISTETVEAPGDGNPPDDTGTEPAPGQDEIEPGDGGQPTIASVEEGISTENDEAPGDGNPLDDTGTEPAPAQDESEPGDGNQPTIARDEEGVSTETIEAPGDGNQPTIARDEEGISIGTVEAPRDGNQPTIARDEEGISTETIEAPGDGNQPTIARGEEGISTETVEAPGDGSQPTTASDGPAEVPVEDQQPNGAEVVSAPKQVEIEPGDGNQPTIASNVPRNDRHPTLAVIGGVVIFILLWFIRIESMPVMGDVTPIQLAFLAIHAIIFGPQVGLITGLLGYAFTIGAHLYEIPDIGFMVGFALMGWLFGIYQKRVINQLNVLGIVKAWIFGILGLFLGYVYFSLILYFETNNLDFQVNLDYFTWGFLAFVFFTPLAFLVLNMLTAKSKRRN